MRFHYLVASSVVVIVGCAPPPLKPHGGTYKFRGPGDLQALAVEFNSCVNQTTPRAVTTVVLDDTPRSVGSYPDCGQLMLCLAAKGYHQDPQGNLDVEKLPRVKCRP